MPDLRPENCYFNLSSISSYIYGGIYDRFMFHSQASSEYFFRAEDIRFIRSIRCSFEKGRAARVYCAWMMIPPWGCSVTRARPRLSGFSVVSAGCPVLASST